MTPSGETTTPEPSEFSIRCWHPERRSLPEEATKERIVEERRDARLHHSAAVDVDDRRRSRAHHRRKRELDFLAGLGNSALTRRRWMRTRNERRDQQRDDGSEVLWVTHVVSVAIRLGAHPTRLGHLVARRGELLRGGSGLLLCRVARFVLGTLDLRIAINQLDHSERRIIAITEAGPEHAGVSAVPLLIAIGQRAKSLPTMVSS